MVWNLHQNVDLTELWPKFFFFEKIIFVNLKSKFQNRKKLITHNCGF